MENQKPCVICKAVKEDKMVACDACEDWFHLQCIKEDETIYDREWMCDNCRPNPIEQNVVSTPAVEGQPDSMKEISRMFEGIKACMEKCTAPFGSLPIEEPCASCDRALGGETAKCSECARKHHVACVDEGEAALGRGWKCSRCKSQAASTMLSSTLATIMERLSSMERKMETNRNGADPRGAIGFMHPCSTAFDHTNFTEGEITRSQASARKVVSGKLPIFSGDPDEWDMFCASFEESTRLCGYSDGENMQRLREALKGHALKAVKRRLYYGDNLSEVLETLRSMYGRPELVIATLRDKIRQAPLPKMEKLETLVEYGLEVEEICATVRKSGVENTYDGPLLEELVARLPPVLRLNWGMHCDALPSVTLAQFARWMTKVRNGALRVSPRPAARDEKQSPKHVNVHSPSHTTTQPRQKVLSTVRQAESSKTELRKCACDDECSRLTECDVFLRMSAENRWKYVNDHHVCKCCLRRHQNQCRLQQPCGKAGCSQRHHTLLHNFQTMEHPGKYESTNSHSVGTHREVLLRYIPITLRAHKREVNVIALLDEGSSVSLMEHTLAQELGLSGNPKPLCLSWTGGQHRDEPESVEVSINISGIRGHDRHYRVPAIRTVRRLGLPTQSLDMDQFGAKYVHLSSLPIPSFSAAAPRILLGMDNYHLTRPLKTVEGLIDEPVATKTRLGWVVSGLCSSSGRYPIVRETISSHRAQLCECRDIEIRIDNALKGSFALEAPRGVVNDVIRSKEDERALELLAKHTNLVEGRYSTGLLWRYNDTVLPKNRSLALKRMDCLERKMSKDQKLRDVMNAKMREYVEKGYIRHLTVEEKLSNHPRVWYLPIFPVFNPNKPNKVRIVWDAAAIFRGHSLNSALSTGPDFLAPLSSVLQRFRERRIAVAADISEMYHQVRINEQDLQSQRFLWKWNPEQAEPDEYVMLRMTFGASCSPSCAQYVKNLNADRFGEQYPEAVKCIKEDHYVDDMLASVEEVTEAIKLTEDVTFIHSQGGFPLHNWMSNSVEVLQAVDSSEHQQKDLTLEPSSTPNKVLVPSLSTSACILAVRNFIARRGTPVEIYSDRGTNFVGASRELREALKEVDMDEMIETMNLPNTQWVFNPPAAPHFGGAWERLIRTVKQTLHNIRFTRHPTDAVLSSWLIEVEHIVNARPLTDVPIDSEEDEPITPNHLLLGSSAGVKPFVTIDDSPDTLRNNWKTSQIYANIFWRKWVAAYLPTLTRRTKWYQPREPLKEGDVVLIVDETLPRGCWPKGRVIRAIQSKDGAVRRVHVRLANGTTCERPAVKIAAIDIDRQGSALTSQNTGGQC
ncbi:uncharacterized protein LOC128309254 [Anopheles moucheti]|uniref:uncharacterized protein LOC128309254 n=1 Tax=Anopheles moucheti TaxID=186751 RepID=UPI0022F08343|nr:uncharacterized protein LOC128309254 [Anopheles moucheti]